MSNQSETNKIMVAATVVMALSAIIQAISIFKDFNVKNILDILGLIAMAVILLAAVKIAGSLYLDYYYQAKKK